MVAGLQQPSRQAERSAQQLYQEEDVVLNALLTLL
jgi:hypothetical protein